MKNLLYLFFITIIACSTRDDSSDNNDTENNNSVGRLIESITVISADCENIQNVWFTYDDNNRVSSTQIQYIESDCNGEQGSYGEIYNVDYIYTSNNVTLDTPFEQFQIPINSEGLADDGNITFVDDFIININPNSILGGDCGVNYIWLENNLMETISYQGASNNGSWCDGRRTIFEYSDNLNLVEHFWISKRFNFDTGLALNGAFGKSSEKLVSKSTSIYASGSTETTNFQYQLNSDGYPTVIYVNSSFGGSNTQSSVVYEVTYID